MHYNAKIILKDISTTLGLAYNVVRGIDYQRLSQYILKINQHKDINNIILEVSMCLKDILNYELFGFALKTENKLEAWIDPRKHGVQISDFISRDFMDQNSDISLHYFEPDSAKKSQYSDTIDINNLISYQVTEGLYAARLYILPQKKMLQHHSEIINIIVNSISIALEKNFSIQQLENAAAIDALTNCYNRRALDRFMKNDIAYSQRTGMDLSVIMLDIDNFKDLNDTHGHLAGDAVLKDISMLINSIIRKSDYVARYGGEEFVLILPDTTLYKAVQLSEKIRKRIEEHEVIFGEKKITLTASFGVASLEHKPDADSLLQEADERLYKAKSAGKNNVMPSLLPCFADKNFVSRSLTRTYRNTPQVA